MSIIKHLGEGNSMPETAEMTSRDHRTICMSQIQMHCGKGQMRGK